MTAISHHDVASWAAADFARQLVACWQSALGPELLGVYLIGSLAHGGFSRRYSDIDMAIVTESGLTADTIDHVRREATMLSPEWGPKVSVFWTDRQFVTGRFPPLDRIDYLDRPLVLMERERLRPQRPSLDEIRSYLRGAPFAGWTGRARQFAAAITLDAKDRKAYLRVLLYPARLYYGYIDGHMGSNDEAVAFLRKQLPIGLDLASIEQALQCRQADADPDCLFELRNILPSQVNACATLIAD
jgi:predicted nucleotidyltransferase